MINPTEVEDAVNTAVTNVDGFVANRFTEATSYASIAITEANTQLNALMTLLQTPAVNTDIALVFNYEGDEITTNFDSAMPESPEFTPYVQDVMPVLEPLQAFPTFSFLSSDLELLRASIIANIRNLLNSTNATGLDATVEQAIYDRAKARQELDNARLYTEAEQYFSARGFELPPGALSGKLQEISIEIARNNNYLINDILVKQADLEQKNRQFYIEKGSLVLTSLVDSGVKGLVEYNKGIIDKHMAALELRKHTIGIKIAELETETKIYIAKLEGYKAIGTVKAADINAQIEIAKIELTKAQLTLEAEMKNASMIMDAETKLHQLQVAALDGTYKAASQIVASALSAVNTSANYGFSGSANMSAGSSYQEIRQDTTTQSSSV